MEESAFVDERMVAEDKEVLVNGHDHNVHNIDEDMVMV